jgi:hypothetical protein
MKKKKKRRGEIGRFFFGYKIVAFTGGAANKTLE